ncbi:MAG: right-handed parallel beta-helix repeat-containing protein [Candidatus Bathyarchaeota archaeon]|nr:right-handed parallel beta-helix repeat-containing protein [Candidatus Bathyarchaeota archaeon]
MRNMLFSAFLISIIVSGFAFLGAANFSAAQVSTNVNGIIGVDTVWTKAKSPYILIGNVLVNNGVTLTIEPGVTVNFDAYYLQIRGTLKAKGSSAENIVFFTDKNFDPYTTQGVIFSSTSTPWMENTNMGCIIEKTSCNQIVLKIDNASPKISQNIFKNTFLTTVISITGGSATILNNTINSSGGGISVTSGAPTISHNIITQDSGTATGLSLGGSAYVSDNVISHYWTGINAGGYAKVERNLIIENRYGIEFGGYNNILIQNNTIANNRWGVSGPTSSVTLTYNNIQNNSQNNLILSTSTNFDAPYNWWGTTETQTINQTIYDFKNEFSLGTVNFVPFLIEPNSQASPISADSSSSSASQGPVYVNGVIISDTQWTKAGSPYILTGHVAVRSGATLIIEAGARVELKQYCIKVNGTLSARGSSVDRVQITGGGYIEFTSVSSGWSDQTSSGCIIENTVIELTDIKSSCCYLKFCGNTLIGKIETSGGTIEISGNSITQESFGRDGILLEGNTNAFINNNVIDSSFAGIKIFSSGTIAIEKNLLTRNINAIQTGTDTQIKNAQVTIQNNTITKNWWGFYLSAIPSPMTVINNNIENNTHENIDLSPGQSYAGLSGNVNAVSNWWGTTDSQAIQQTIIDFNNDYDIGTVNFIPFLSEPNPNAPDASSSESPSSTSTPSATPQVTQTPPPTPAPTPATQTPTPNSIPTPTSTHPVSPKPASDSINVQLDSRYDGQAVFTNEKTHTSPYSAKLSIPKGANSGSWAIALYPYGQTLRSLSTFSVYASYKDAAPRFLLYLDTNNDEFTDAVLLSHYQETNNGEWAAITNGNGDWSEAVNSLSGYEGNWKPLGDWETNYGDAAVLFIGVGLDYESFEPDGFGEPLYADELMVNGVTYRIASVQTAPPPQSPSPSSSVASSPFWTIQTILITLTMIGVLSTAVSVPTIRVYRKNRGNILKTKADDLQKKGNPLDAAKFYAKAYQSYIKLNQPQAAIQALIQYAALAKSLTLQTFMSVGKEKAPNSWKLKRINKINSALKKDLSNAKTMALIPNVNLDKIHVLDVLLSRARGGDLDFVVNEMLNDVELSEHFKNTLQGVDQISVIALAEKLGYSTVAAVKLLARGVELQKADGVFSNDGKRYVSKGYIRQQLFTRLS